MTPGASIVAYSAAWGAFGISSGWLAHKAPVRWFAEDRWLTRMRPFEHRGRWYDRRLRVRWWKDRLPEAGGWFRGGWSKKRITSFAPDDLARLAAETRRAEWVHWINVAFGFTFAAWTEPVVAAGMIAFGLGVHLPFVIVQRYNRARLLFVLS